MDIQAWKIKRENVSLFQDAYQGWETDEFWVDFTDQEMESMINLRKRGHGN